MSKTWTPKVKVVGTADGDPYQGYLHIPHGTAGTEMAQRVIHDKIMAWLEWRQSKGYRLISGLNIGGPFSPLDPTKLGYDLYVIQGRFRLERSYEISLDTAIANRDRQAEYGVEQQEHQELESNPWVASPDDAEYYERLKKEAEDGTRF